MPYEGNPDAESGPSQLGGGLSNSWYPLNAVQASGTDYARTSSSGGGGGFSSSGGGSSAGGGSGSRFGLGDIFLGSDGHYYYRNANGEWADSGQTDGAAAATSIAAALGLPAYVTTYVVRDAQINSAQQSRGLTTGAQYKLIGVNSNGTVDVQAPDGSIQQKSATEAGTLPGIAQSDLEQAQQEAVYRQMRANTAQFQMGAMPNVYAMGMPGAQQAPSTQSSVGTSGATNPYTGSTGGLTGQEAQQAPQGGGAMPATGSPEQGNAVTATSMGHAGTGGTMSTNMSNAITSNPSQSVGTTGTGTSGNAPMTSPDQSFHYANDNSVQGFEQGNQAMNDYLERMKNTYQLGSADYTNGMSRSGWNNWYQDQLNTKNQSAMGRQSDLSFDGNGNYSGTDWMGNRVSGYTPDSLINNGSATAADLEKARYNWQNWKSSQNMQNLAATSRNLSGMGFSAIGAPRIAGYG